MEEKFAINRINTKAWVLKRYFHDTHHHQGCRIYIESQIPPRLSSFVSLNSSMSFQDPFEDFRKMRAGGYYKRVKDYQGK